MANRVLIGKKGTSDYGLYVSNPGVNVLTASADNLMFNSDAKESFNVLQTGTVSVAAPGTTQGYVETVSAWVSYTSLGLTYAPLIEIAGSFSAGVSAFDADTFLSSEGFYEPLNVDVFQFSASFVENDFTNEQFRVYSRRYNVESTFGGDSLGITTAKTVRYFIFAVGDVAGNASSIYYTSGP